MRALVTFRKIAKDKKLCISIWWGLFFLFIFMLSFPYAIFEVKAGSRPYYSGDLSPYSISGILVHLKSAFVLTLSVASSSTLSLLLLGTKIFGRDNAIGYSLHILSLLVLSLFTALLYNSIATAISGLQINVVIVYAGFVFSSLAVSGFLYLLDAISKANKLRRAQRFRGIRRTEGVDGKQAAKKDLQIIKTSLKVGSKCDYRIICLDNIAYVEGNGNEPKIVLADGTEVLGNRSIKDFKEKLPDDLFVQCHRSFLVSKDKVVRRKKNSRTKNDFLFIQMEEETRKIPVGALYRKAINSDPSIGLVFS